MPAPKTQILEQGLCCPFFGDRLGGIEKKITKLGFRLEQVIFWASPSRRRTV